MPSTDHLREYDRLLGTGLVALLAGGIAIGYLFENWTVVDSWVPAVGIALVLYLLYRFVAAVEHMAYDR